MFDNDNAKGKGLSDWNAGMFIQSSYFYLSVVHLLCMWSKLVSTPPSLLHV